MTMRPVACLALLVSLLLASCTGGPGQPDQTAPGGTSPQPTSATDDGLQLDCEREGYPCSRDDVHSEVLELESQYVADIAAMLDTGASYAEAVEWVRQQEAIVAAEADEHEMFFRLDGGQPLSFSEILTDPDAPPIAGGLDAVLAGVVGHGTPRANPQNLKRALLLDPLSRDKRSGFSLVRPGLEAIRDYAHPAGVTYAESVEVTPVSFAGWSDYDAIFVATHGGLKGGSWLATGIYEPRDSDEDFDDQCAGMMEAGWEATYLARCTVFDHVPIGQTEKVRFIGVVVTGDYFRETYGRTGGLAAAIVYIGGCDGLNMTDIRDALVGSSSVFVGWTAVTESPYWENATVNLLHALIQGRPIEQARAVVCDGTKDETKIGCRVPSTGAELQVRGSADARKLRLYDVPTELRHPSRGATPVSVGPLEDGARVPIIGTPGDEVNDEVELMIDFIGIFEMIDPDDTDSDLLGQTDVRLASAQLGDRILAQGSDAARGYYFTVEVNGTLLVRDNLGKAQHPGASATPLDSTTYRYAFTAELPFDVDPAGTPATIKVTVDLPEGGISDYEIDVILGDEPLNPCEIVSTEVINDTLGTQLLDPEDMFPIGRLCAWSEPRPDPLSAESVSSIDLLLWDETSFSYLQAEMEAHPEWVVEGVGDAAYYLPPHPERDYGTLELFSNGHWLQVLANGPIKDDKDALAELGKVIHEALRTKE